MASADYKCQPQKQLPFNQTMQKHKTHAMCIFLDQTAEVDSPLEKTGGGCESEKNAPAETARCRYSPKTNRPTDNGRSPISTAGQALVRTSSSYSGAYLVYLNLVVVESVGGQGG